MYLSKTASGRHNPPGSNRLHNKPNRPRYESSSPLRPQRYSGGGGGDGGWEAVERFGDGAVSTPIGETSLCEELALDAAGCVVADSIVERPRGWTILRPLLASLDRAAVQRVGPDRGGLEWQRVVSWCTVTTREMSPPVD